MSTDSNTKLLGDSNLFLKYDVRVYLPPGTRNVPKVYNKLRVEMPLFQIGFIDTEPVRFSEVDLKTENAPVTSTVSTQSRLSENKERDCVLSIHVLIVGLLYLGIESPKYICENEEFGDWGYLYGG